MRILGAVLERSGSATPFAESKPFTVGWLELDAPGPGEVLRPHRGRPASATRTCRVVDGNRVRPTPMLLGHEAAGIVEALGDGVDDLAIGDRVVMTFLPRCGECAECATDGRLPCRVGSAANSARLARRRRDRACTATASACTTTWASRRSPRTRWSAGRPSSRSTPTSRPRSPLCSAAPCSPAAVRWSTPAGPRQGDTRDRRRARRRGHGRAARRRRARVRGDRRRRARGQARRRARELGHRAVYAPDEASAAGVRAPVVIEAAGNARAFETAFARPRRAARRSRSACPHPDARASVAPVDPDRRGADRGRQLPRLRRPGPRHPALRRPVARGRAAARAPRLVPHHA